MPPDPLGGRLERLGNQPQVMDAPLPAAGDEPGGLQDAQMPGYGGKRDGERVRDLTDGSVRPGEPREDRAPRGIGKRREGGVEGGGLINHNVNY
jgi:hypothetical protein